MNAKSEYRKSFGSVSPQRSISLDQRRSDLTAHSSRDAGRRPSSCGPARCSVPAAGPDPHPHQNSPHRKQTDHRSKPFDHMSTCQTNNALVACQNVPVVRPRPPEADSQSQASIPNGHGPPANEDQHALPWRAGLGSVKGERSKERASPLLTAQQMLRSGCWSPHPFGQRPVAMETEYRRSYQGQALPPGPRLRKHLEHQLPLFHMSTMKREESIHQRQTTPPPHRRHRKLTEYEANFRSPVHKMAKDGGPSDHTPQVAALRRQASWYRRRAWGTHFSREHLSQLLSEHNSLWEPADSIEGSPGPGSHPASERHASPGVEALDLGSRSSLSSAASSGPAHRGAEDDDDDMDEEEGRLPTPKMKMQRTHHDVTTPATGGAILVGRPPGEEGCTQGSARTHATPRRCGATLSVATPRETWPDNPSPLQKSKPIRSRLSPPPPPQHCLRGRLRHAEFQHNGELGLRFRGHSGSAPPLHRLDDAASAVLERARRRREDFWGKS
ncbi:nuclear protein MDM1 [Dunckerocampus dactyliophorus]|uniref:nuclear protein MDM1 n=1 Tax=Dunckerocampus dactyliophorus TaxID=161453 RepID=UPI0024059F49|nr:nuclear protein MDM1 [Dunckerocampus dactyliophorus]